MLAEAAAEAADALDALVALDTALHVRADDYEELGGERDATGLVMRMVFQVDGLLQDVARTLARGRAYAKGRCVQIVVGEL